MRSLIIQLEKESQKIWGFLDKNMNLQYAKHLKSERKILLGGFIVEQLDNPQFVKDLSKHLTELDEEIYKLSK